MPALTLDHLPPPPPETAGWPWREAAPTMPPAMPDGRPWPRISIVTPSYNRRGFIEAAIRSVLLQGYPDVEHIVIDGASTDGTVDVIRRYAPWLASWTSEPDRGIPDALNKGFARATGALLAFLGSDDLYLPGALRRFAEAHAAAPDALVMGDVEIWDEQEGRGEVIRQANITFRNLVESWRRECVWHFAGLMVPRALYLAVGGLDERLPYANDRDWLCRLIQRAPVAYLGRPVVRFRVHGANTSAAVPAVLRENFEITQRYWAELGGIDPRATRAAYHLNAAAVYLAHHPGYARFWNRSAGARELAAAWRVEPTLIFSSHFRRLWRRALTPRRLLRSSPWATR